MFPLHLSRAPATGEGLSHVTDLTQVKESGKGKVGKGETARHR